MVTTVALILQDLCLLQRILEQNDACSIIQRQNDERNIVSLLAVKHLPFFIWNEEGRVNKVTLNSCLAIENHRNARSWPLVFLRLQN